jgi:hypothetical protein
LTRTAVGRLTSIRPPMALRRANRHSIGQI